MESKRLKIEELIEEGDIERVPELLLAIPNDVRVQIVSYLSIRDILRVCALNVQLKVWCDNSRELWNIIFQRNFSDRLGALTIFDLKNLMDNITRTNYPISPKSLVIAYAMLQSILAVPQEELENEYYIVPELVNKHGETIDFEYYGYTNEIGMTLSHDELTSIDVSDIMTDEALQNYPLKYDLSDYNGIVSFRLEGPLDWIWILYLIVLLMVAYEFQVLNARQPENGEQGRLVPFPLKCSVCGTGKSVLECSECKNQVFCGQQCHDLTL